ncbi:MAG: protein kinase, partial [Desulfatitalea sp.]|nr:protein kinase [Desulfatitalea sp.]
METTTQTQDACIAFDAYDIEAVLFDGDPTRIYRARRCADGMPVMLKALRNETAARQAAACLQHEFEITRRLAVPSVIRALALERHAHLPVIVFEDFGGDSLNNLARNSQFSLEELLKIAIQAAHGLTEIHAANIIHKDINPSNIVYNPVTGVVKIIDFGISSYLTREQAAVAGPQVFEGSLPYISP